MSKDHVDLLHSSRLNKSDVVPPLIDVVVIFDTTPEQSTELSASVKRNQDSTELGAFETYFIQACHQHDLSVQCHCDPESKKKYYGLSVSVDQCRSVAMSNMPLKRRRRRESGNNRDAFDVEFTSGERIELIQHLLDAIARSYPALDDHQVLNSWSLHNEKELHWLQEEWIKFKPRNGRGSSWIADQPLDAIRLYFGEDVGFYFSFLGFYTQWLCVPSLLGLVVSILSWLSFESAGDEIFFGTIDETSTRKMPWYVAIYSMLLTIWATVFLEMWKRNQSQIAWKWGVLSMPASSWIESLLRMPFLSSEGLSSSSSSKVLERECCKDSSKTTVSRISGMQRIARYVITLPTVCFALLCILALALFAFQVDCWAQDTFTLENHWTGNWLYLKYLPIAVYCLAVVALDKQFYALATRLTEYENHSTKEDHVQALMLKLVALYFINNFSYMFYIAFIQQDFELLQQTLAGLLMTRQVLGNVQEVGVPMLMKLYGVAQVKKTKLEVDDSIPQILDQMLEEQALPKYDGTFDDYLELFIQFGQIALFAAAYPLAPVCSLVNNVMEIRSDAYTLCRITRRPSRPRACGIGFWLVAFECLGYLAVVTNLALIGLYSNIMESMLGPLTLSLKILVIVALEHGLVGLKLVMENLVPDVSTTIVDAWTLDQVELIKDVVVDRRRYHESMRDSKNVSESRMSLTNLGIQPQASLEIAQEVERLDTLYRQWIRREVRRRKEVETELARVEAELHLALAKHKKWS